MLAHLVLTPAQLELVDACVESLHGVGIHLDDKAVWPAAHSAHGWARLRTVGYHMPTPRQLPRASLAVSQRHTQNPNNSRFADPPSVRFNRVQVSSLLRRHRAVGCESSLRQYGRTP